MPSSWKEVSPGHWERSPLDPSEGFFLHLGNLPHPPGRERWALTAVSTFKTDLAENEILPALRHAWKELRHKFPILGAKLEKDRKTYEVPDDAAIESWLDQTIIVEPNDADADTIIGTYKSTELSILHYLPGSSQVLMHLSHWRVDGIGLCLLTHSFFNVLANPKEVTFGDEGKRLSPSIEEASGISDPTEEGKQKVKDDMAKALAGGRSAALPLQAVGPAKGTYRRTYEFSESTTSGIVAACKRRGVSVTTAITAALTLTVRKHEEAEPEQRGERMTFNPYYSLRQYMPPTFKSEDHPTCMMVVGDGVDIKLLDFEDSIKQIAPQFSKDLTDLTKLTGSWYQHHIDLITTPPPQPAKPAGGAAAAPATPAKPPPKPAVTPALNSIGILDRYMDAVHQGPQRRFEISEFWFAVEILGPVILCYVWTFRGKMRLTPYYNEAFYTAEYVQKILDSLKDITLEKLEVKE